MSDTKTYARVVDGVVVEYPVLPLHITNRGHPLDWYTEVIFRAKPELPAFHYYVEKLSVVGDKVYASYSVEEKSLQTVLDELSPMDPTGMLTGLPSTTRTPPAIADVDPAVVAQIAHLSDAMVTDKLNAFAAERQYRSIDNVPTYLTSEIPRFAADAKRALKLRDQCWANMIQYQTDIMTAAKPVPTTVDEIMSVLPALTWED